MQLSKPRLIQLIHIAKGQLELEDLEYRIILLNLTGKDSCKTMCLASLIKVYKYMCANGFEPVTKKSSNKKLSPKSRDKEVKTQLDKLRQLWIEMNRAGYLQDGSDHGLLNWSKSQAKRFNNNVSVERLEWLQPGVLNMLIEQLKQWQKRCDKKALINE